MFTELFKVQTESVIFRIQTLLSFIIFTLITLISFIVPPTTNSTPLSCSSNNHNGSSFDKLTSDKCYLKGTFVLETHLDSVIGSDVPSIGVHSETLGEPRLSLTYYKFMPWLFLCHALLALINYIFYRFFERNLIGYLCRIVTERQEGKITSLLVPAKSRNTQKDNLEYIGKYLFIVYFIAEVIILINLVLAIAFHNHMLNGYFYTFGARLFFEFAGISRQRNSLIEIVFPNQAMCELFSYGNSNSLNSDLKICTLNYNYVYYILNLISWAWLMLVLKLAISSLLARIFFMMSKRVRLMSIEPVNPKRFVHLTEAVLMRNTSFISCFILYVISFNVSTKEIDEICKISLANRRLLTTNGTASDQNDLCSNSDRLSVELQEKA